jgi:formate dehydrogenase alpha subunit
MAAISGGLGYPMEYESPQDIQSEIMKLLPGYYNLGQPKTIVPAPDAYLAVGYRAEVASRYRAEQKQSGKEPGQQRFGLIMGQLLYHSGKLSTQASGLIQLAPNTGRLHMNVDDIERMGLSDGGRVRVTSSVGSVELGVEVDRSVLAGSCFFPEHFNEPPVKDLMAVEVDSTTGVPYFKFAQVMVEKI